MRPRESRLPVLDVEGCVMGWFDRRKGKQTMSPAMVATDLHTAKADPKRPGSKSPAAPTKRGKTLETRESETAMYRAAMRGHVAEIAAFNRERSMGLGVTSYQWLSMDVHGCCDIAKRNNGRIFSYDAPPPEGHVGEGQCNSPDWCRCISRPIVPGFS
jgi:hypothetical protein